MPPSRSRNPLRTLLATLACSAPLLAAAPDEPFEWIGKQIVFTDGYRTLVDVRHPSGPQPTTGWPTVVLVHSGGGERGGLADTATYLAHRGYLSIAYDVRGQGEGMLLNDPDRYGRGLFGIRERLDLFEVFERVQDLLPGAVDADRLAVVGGSQGGLHAWIAAAHSGRIPPANPWRSEPFPTIACVVAINFSPDLANAILPQGVSINVRAVEAFFGNGGVHHDPALVPVVRDLVLAQDYAGLQALFGDSELDLIELLRTSQVPILARLVYDDYWAPGNSAVALWRALLSSDTARLDISTGGHGSQENLREDELRMLLKVGWLDYWLRSIDNGILDLPPIRMAIVPDRLADFQNPKTLWDYASLDSVASKVLTHRLYLHQGAELAEHPPASWQSSSTILQELAAPYDIADFIEAMPTPRQLQEWFQPASIEFNSEPLPADLLIVGAPSLTLRVESASSAYQVHASLLDLAPDGSERVITGGTVTRRGFGASRPLLSLPLRTIAYRINAGHRLGLRLDTLSWHRPLANGQDGFLEVLPVFESFSVELFHEVARASFLELPLIHEGEPRLVASPVHISAAHPRDLDLALYSGRGFSGWYYAILASLAGTEPGIDWKGQVIPLTPDALTYGLMRAARRRPLGLVGRLDKVGSAGAFLPVRQFASRLPVGKSITAIGLVWDGARGFSYSQPVLLPIE